MRFSRPSTGTILGAVALFIALGGTALAATGTVVNIADSTTATNVAHVNSNGALQTTGSANITNTVNTQLAPPSAYVHRAKFNLSDVNGCVTVATPPANKAMIVRDVRIDVFDDRQVTASTSRSSATPAAAK